MRAQRNARRSNALGLPDGIALIRIAYERGHTMPRAATLRRIAAAGGVTVEALRDGAAPHWLHDGAWEEAVALLRTVWRDASRRPLVLRTLRALTAARPSQAPPDPA